MKSAEEWSFDMARLSDDAFCFDQNGAEEVIQKIQLDAIREGMRRAAEIGMNKSPMPLPPGEMTTLEKRTTIVNAILTAAEKLTIENL
jgi:hypothetical protein